MKRKSLSDLMNKAATEKNIDSKPNINLSVYYGGSLEDEVFRYSRSERLGAYMQSNFPRIYNLLSNLGLYF
ncbi:hypothetical protein GF361_03040 [Candidatus Woesearchaeota archaeon]|nr:hypothetical protein [Candidatus Woesearchaeota archaeon]